MTRPNVILVVLDTARAETVYSLLDRGELPGMQKFDETGTRFERAFTTSPWTLPSHASLFTGQRTGDHGTHAGNKAFDPSVPPLAELLSEQGYETRGISANGWISSEFGFDRGFDALSMKWDRFWRGEDLTSVKNGDGIERYQALVSLLASAEAPYTLANALYGKLFASRTDNGAAMITTRTVEWLRSYDREQPFFFFLNYLEPHLQYDPPAEYVPDDLPKPREEVNQDPWEYIAGPVSMDERDFDTLRALYRAEIRYLDAQLERLYDTLESMDRLDETAVFIVGDHGENIGDHSLMDHQYSLHDTLLHVPLLARYPAEFDPTRREDLVEVRDLYPTIAALADAPTSGDGVSARDLTAPGGRDAVFAEYRYPQPTMDALEEKVSTLRDGYETLDRTLRSVRTEQWKLIEADDGEATLYRAGSETTDLSDEHPDVVEDLRARMESKGVKLGKGEKKDREISDTHQERLEALGYI